MRVSLVPDRLLETYEEITPEYLRQRGIRLLLSDLDYTLAPKYVPHPDDRVREWLRRMEEGGGAGDDPVQQPLLPPGGPFAGSWASPMWVMHRSPGPQAFTGPWSRPGSPPPRRP